MTDNFGYYQVLGVSQNATPEEIKRAYREKAKKYHPDLCSGPDCVQKFREVNEAYEFLKNSKQRTIYNTQYANWGQFREDETYRYSLDQIILNLINSLNNPNSLMRNYAVEALVRIGAAAFDAVIKASNSTDEVIRRKSCDILGRMGNPNAIPSLIRLLNDPDRYVRRRAAKALTRIYDQSTVVPLMNSLQDHEKKVRYRSAEALGKIGDKRAVDQLIKSLNDPSSTVRRKVIVALGEIGDPKAVDHIRLCLKDDSGGVRSTAKHILKYGFHVSYHQIVKPTGRLNKRSAELCPKCGNPCIPNSNYCPTCGHRLNHTYRICGKCGNLTKADDNFCTTCGASVKKY